MTTHTVTVRCVGREIPFGSTYSHPECETCSRPGSVAQAVWMGPVKFDTRCPFKIKVATPCELNTVEKDHTPEY